MNVAEALQYWGEADSYERQESLWLLEHLLDCSVLELKFKTGQCLTAEQERLFLDGLNRLKQNEPLAYITGSQPFWTLDLKVTTDTLVPRPDTEILIETVLGLPLGDISMLDLGTGTGAIALALASERPTWQILATDIYEPTLQVAQFNAQKYALKQVKFACSAWFSQLDAQKFDLIVSNPPYIDPIDDHLSDLVTEPQRALTSEEHGLADIKEIIDQSPNWLNSKGWLVLEHGYDQGLQVQALLDKAGFTKVKTVQDYGKNDRVTLGQLN